MLDALRAQVLPLSHTKSLARSNLLMIPELLSALFPQTAKQDFKNPRIRIKPSQYSTIRERRIRILCAGISISCGGHDPKRSRPQLSPTTKPPTSRSDTGPFNITVPCYYGSFLQLARTPRRVYRYLINTHPNRSLSIIYSPPILSNRYHKNPHIGSTKPPTPQQGGPLQTQRL